MDSKLFLTCVFFIKAPVLSLHAIYHIIDCEYGSQLERSIRDSSISKSSSGPCGMC